MRYGQGQLQELKNKPHDATCRQLYEYVAYVVNGLIGRKSEADVPSDDISWRHVHA